MASVQHPCQPKLSTSSTTAAFWNPAYCRSASVELLGESGGRGIFDVNLPQQPFPSFFSVFVCDGIDLSRFSLAFHEIDFTLLQHMLLAVLCQNIDDTDIRNEKAIVEYYVACIHLF